MRHGISLLKPCMYNTKRQQNEALPNTNYNTNATKWVISHTPKYYIDLSTAHQKTPNVWICLQRTIVYVSQDIKSLQIHVVWSNRPFSGMCFHFQKQKQHANSIISSWVPWYFNTPRDHIIGIGSVYYIIR